MKDFFPTVLMLNLSCWHQYDSMFVFQIDCPLCGFMVAQVLSTTFTLLKLKNMGHKSF